MGPYQNYNPNFPMYYSINDCYARQSSLQTLVDQHNQLLSPRAPGNIPKQTRFLSINNDWTLLKNALAYPLLARGIPILYGMPAKTTLRSRFNTDIDLYQLIAKALAAKRAAGGLVDNGHVHLYVMSTAYAFSRTGGNSSC